MAYAAWSVIAGEQPTAAKWNILGTNDASFNDGSGLAFTTNNVVPGNALSTTAISLGYTQTTATFTSTTATAYFDITGMTVTVTVPAGGRRCLIQAFARRFVSSQSPGSIYATINEGATKLSEIVAGGPAGASSFNMPVNVFYSGVLSAGSHTYKMQGQQDNAGTYTFDAAATYPAFIAVWAF